MVLASSVAAITSQAAINSPLVQVLLALAAVIIAGRFLGWLLAWLQQPPVMGEVLAGILLGPSLLGWISREWLGYEKSPLLPRKSHRICR